MMQNDSEPKKQSPLNGVLPSHTRKLALVRCRGYRCLAYQDAQGRWRNHHNNELLPEVLEVLEVLNR